MMMYLTKEKIWQDYLTIREQLIKELVHIPQNQIKNVIELRKFEDKIFGIKNEERKREFLKVLSEKNSKPNSLLEANCFVFIADGKWIVFNNFSALGEIKKKILKKNTHAVILIHELGKKIDFTLSEKILPSRKQWYEIFGESRGSERIGSD